MSSIHETAIRLLSIYGDRKHGAARRAVMRQCAARAVAESDDRPDIRARDYREWRPDWDWSMPLPIGSGRAAEWCFPAYRWYAHVATLLHRDLGWTGQRVRETARALLGRHLAPRSSRMPYALPTTALLRAVQGARSPRGEPGVNDAVLAWEEMRVREGAMSEDESIRETHWQIWLRHVAEPSWGHKELRRIVYRMDHSDSLAPSLAISSIRRWRGDEGSTDYRGCSGCEWLSALHDEPALWDGMLARARPPIHGRCGPLDAVWAPLGIGVPAEYDHTLVLGLDYEIRVRSADYERANRADPPAALWRFEALPPTAHPDAEK